ncbi:Trimethylamine-N-oxide reductase 1 precursor [Edwardsiella tarda]|uniref:Trimethylamine-N-oxide reductase TorA n=2 Tax=Edwardsiella tarda TaxID=636 RepID=A0AC61TGX6_EDWTA|nr:trimethylamine-N-oxide reductase TorA [Edwardsiella tarda]AKH90247.1 trimethylamine-N-oxide reductase TorA [Edwardsiella tarda]UAL57015.1 trimethylamine-N-oxide reductase TorA [Edwardsiella tarda]UCP99931.1 trimethylamine-N-oxide reductase TorA [Edwardsiella tarda ATCC 15947 = NBRC 105688]STD31176.1 Trimethylamine-N-oxide reductase 1 precursor [Edwardsiella tarda]
MNKNESVSVSRRRFLSQLGGLTALGLLGPSLLVARDARATTATAASGTQEGILTGSHWGAIRATVVDGRFVAAKPFELDKYPSKMVAGLPDHVHNTARIRYPMVRIDWMRKRHNSDTRQRGDNRFVRVSWDEALDLFYQELERIQTTYGPSALLSGSGWQSTGMFHNAAGMMGRALALHGNYVGTGGDYSTGAAQVILPRVVGSMEVYEQQTSWPLVLENSQTIVLWGSDLVKNQQANWWCPDHDVYQYYAQLKEKVASGAIRVISIDTVVSSTHDYLGRDKVQHLAVNPQTDVPLQLALAHTLYSERLYDAHFLDNYTVGFDQFLPYLLGTQDGQPKDAEWAAKLTGIDAETIRALARQMAAGRTQIIAGWCVQRMQHGEQWAWMIVVLAAMLGQIGLPGGGFGFGWHYNGAGTPSRKGVILSGFSGATNTPPLHNNSDYRGYSSTIPIARFIDAMLEPGKTIDWNGKQVKLPPLKMCVFAGTNPFHRHQQINRMIAGWQTLETVVAIDNQWTSTCRFADIVLPATTQFERNDLDQYGNHSNRGILAMKQLVPPQFEARNDFDIFRDLCRRFNREQAFSEGLDEMGWIKRIYQEGAQQGKGRGIHLPPFDTFWNESGYVEFGDPQMFVRHQAFREDPDLEPLGTPSGLIEIYSKSIADMHYRDCQGHPMWFEKVERSHGGPGSARFPLHLQSVHPDFRLHSQLCESETLRAHYSVAGREPVFISPQDAQARGIRNGDVVRVFNDRGQVLAGAVVSDRYVPGVIRIHEGAWYDPDRGGVAGALCKYGNPNVLTLDIGSSRLAQATSAHTAIVEIEKYRGPLEPVSAFNGPQEMVAQCHYVPMQAEAQA